MKIYRARGESCAIELPTEDSYKTYNESSKNQVKLLECVNLINLHSRRIISYFLAKMTQPWQFSLISGYDSLKRQLLTNILFLRITNWIAKKNIISFIPSVSFSFEWSQEKLSKTRWVRRIYYAVVNWYDCAYLKGG